MSNSGNWHTKYEHTHARKHIDTFTSLHCRTRHSSTFPAYPHCRNCIVYSQYENFHMKIHVSIWRTYVISVCVPRAMYVYAISCNGLFIVRTQALTLSPTHQIYRILYESCVSYTATAAAATAAAATAAAADASATKPNNAVFWIGQSSCRAIGKASRPSPPTTLPQTAPILHRHKSIHRCVTVNEFEVFNLLFVFLIGKVHQASIPSARAQQPARTFRREKVCLNEFCANI